MAYQLERHIAIYSNAGRACEEYHRQRQQLHYVFTFKDHLGNNRLCYGFDPSDGILKILEDNAYYPFGMRHEGYNWTSRTYLNAQNGIVIDTPPPCFEDGVFLYK